MSYSRKYFHILNTIDAGEILALTNDKRIHVMKSLAVLSKFIGCYDKWKEIKDRYRLSWSNEDSLAYFNNIFYNGAGYRTMIAWLKGTYSKLPQEYGNCLIYCLLTGLRPDEACKSIFLIHTDLENYLNRDTMTLEHFKYPGIFLRRTKKAYVSILTDKILEIAMESGCFSYNAIRMKIRKTKTEMKMAYSRKIFATDLRMNGIEQETIDLLQGRIPKSVFARHYFRLGLDYQKKIRMQLDSLYQMLKS
jgi:hypothetical protein